MSECPDCHRPLWRAGSILRMQKCTKLGGPLCQLAAAAYRLGRAAGMDEAVEVAKAHALAFCTDCRWKSGEEIDWTEVDAEIERRKGE